MDCKNTGAGTEAKKKRATRELRVNRCTWRVINVWYYKQLGNKNKDKMLNRQVDGQVGR